LFGLDIHVLSKEVTFSSIEGNAVIEVVFFSFPEYRSVSWTNVDTDVSMETSSRHNITTTGGRTRRTYITRMEITSLRDTDYTKYKIAISNELAKTVYFITLQNPDEGLSLSISYE